jgi:hypothetical protein
MGSVPTHDETAVALRLLRRFDPNLATISPRWKKTRSIDPGSRFWAAGAG